MVLKSDGYFKHLVLRQLDATDRAGQVNRWMRQLYLKNLFDKLAEADFVISVLPSTPETKGLLTEEHFKAMKDNARLHELWPRRPCC